MPGQKDKFYAPSMVGAKELAALRKNAPTADQILNNDEYMQELSNEIEKSYDQHLAVDLAAEDPELKNIIQSKKEKVVEPPLTKVKKKMPAVEATATQEDQLQEWFNKIKSAPSNTVVEERAVIKSQEPVDPDQQRKEEILKVLAGCNNAPSAEQIAAWKQEHGQNGVNVMAFGDKEAFVFTFLRRKAWQMVQKGLQEGVEKGVIANADDELKQRVVQMCVLYPRLTLEFFYTSRAGTIDTLFDVIMLNSYFLNTSQAMMLTTSL